MDTNELYLSYARVIEMCKGTTLENKPWECVKHDGECYFHNHPRFNSTGYKFAVAILKDDHTGKDRPVWVGDVLYNKDTGNCYVVSELSVNSILNKSYTWEKPPKPKRIFTLNGVELPCPVGYDSVGMRYSLEIEDNKFYFDSIKNRNVVCDHVKNLLTEARDKQ